MNLIFIKKKLLNDFKNHLLKNSGLKDFNFKKLQLYNFERKRKKINFSKEKLLFLPKKIYPNAFFKFRFFLFKLSNQLHSERWRDGDIPNFNKWSFKKTHFSK